MTWWNLILVDKVPGAVLFQLVKLLSHRLRPLGSVRSAHGSVVGLWLFDVELSRENELRLVSCVDLGGEFGCQNPQGVLFRGICCVDVASTSVGNGSG